jgi:hypothetical protein
MRPVADAKPLHERARSRLRFSVFTERFAQRDRQRAPARVHPASTDRP